MASEEFGSRLRAAGADQWDRPTPCEEWDVRKLVEHMVGGQRMSSMLLDGASKDEVFAMFATDHLGDDPVGAWARTSADEQAAFARPGALEMIVHHPVGEITGAQFLGFRIMDSTLHAWDLARAVGADESLEPAAVEAAWAVLEPMAPFIDKVGRFGQGPSGEVADDAPRQLRLLDLSGRRP